MNKIISKFVDKCLSLSRLGDKYLNHLIAGLIEAGRTISYLETYNPKQTDLFHKEIRFSDKRTFMKTFERAVRKTLPKLNLKRIKVAFDTTEDLTWCKKSPNTRASNYKHELSAWHFLNLSIVEPYFIPLMSIPYTMFDNIDNLVINLVGYLESLSLKVELILFDRGFYHKHLIDFLNSKNLPYLMLIPKNSIIKKYIEQTNFFASYNHRLEYKKEGSTWQTHTIVMIKKSEKDNYFCYATNQRPSLNLCRIYKKRWNIETGFRIHDEARIKSKSRFSLIRFFYHLIGMLLILIWRLELTKRRVTFKLLLKDIERVYSGLLSVPPPPPL